MGNLGSYLLAMIGGIAVAVQGQFMSVMTQTLGARESVFITYGVGGLVAVAIMAGAHGGNLRAWTELPWYVLTSGLTGLVIVGTIGYFVPRVGMTGGFTVMVASQFITGMVIDRFGLFGAAVRPIGLARLAGLALMMGGVVLLLRTPPE